MGKAFVFIFVFSGNKTPAMGKEFVFIFVFTTRHG